MNMRKIEKYLIDDKIYESSDDKKIQMYREGVYSLRNAFNEFSQYYMKAMGLMMQGKKVVNPKYKKMRDSISIAYEKMDDSISKHLESINKDAEEMERR